MNIFQSFVRRFLLLGSVLSRFDAIVLDLKHVAQREFKRNVKLTAKAKQAEADSTRATAVAKNIKTLIAG